MKQRLLTTALIALTAMPLHAAEEGVALSPFAGNLGNAIWTLAIFVIVVIVLGKFAWGPVLGLLQQREEFIHRSLAEAKRDRDEAEARLKEYAAKLQTAQVEAGRIVEEARRDAEKFGEELRLKAKAQADAIVGNAERQIQLQTTQALQQIRQEAVDLSVAIASKLLQRNLTREDNDRLIDEALRQVDSRKH
ncbi:MAG TPA: F0F1 ATP synthase subunit B [Vicinamibacterales bacterium]|jgi:F-type H+-transporting ATPase subunit b|nr:F0F1 ATP synthase subunit B [Vicinamibacterales bacterium]